MDSTRDINSFEFRRFRPTNNCDLNRLNFAGICFRTTRLRLFFHYSQLAEQKWDWYRLIQMRQKCATNRACFSRVCQTMFQLIPGIYVNLTERGCIHTTCTLEDKNVATYSFYTMYRFSCFTTRDFKMLLTRAKIARSM